MPQGPQQTFPITLTANLSGDPTNPTVGLVASGSIANLWDPVAQKLDLSSLTQNPSPHIDVTVQIGTSTLPGSPSVNFPSATNPNQGITIKYKNNPNSDPPPGLFRNLSVSSDTQTLYFQDKNGDRGDYSFFLHFAVGSPNNIVMHDPEIQNSGAISG